jgi:hypothetical protein
MSVCDTDSVLRLSRWLSQGNVIVLTFALVQHVMPLCLLWPLAQLFPVAWAGTTGQLLSKIDCLKFVMCPLLVPAFQG